MNLPSTRAWLAPLAALSLWACTDSTPSQILTGRVALSSGVVAVRAVTDDNVVTAAQIRSDRSWTLALPAGSKYRLEMLTSTNGVQHVITGAGTNAAHELTFRVCQPTTPWDCGTVGSGSGSAGGGGGPMCGPNDPMCPPPCDPATDPNGCQPPKCDPTTDPNGCGMTCDPMTDPTCVPPCDPMTDPTGCAPPCDPTTDPYGCQPPHCDPMTDPNGCAMPCDPTTDPNGCKVCDPTTDPNCGTACDPTDPVCSGCMDPNGMACPPPPPPCQDPNDPTTCKDPCMGDPTNCGCAADDPGCWPAPDPGGACEGGMQPANPPGDFGCADGSTGT